MNVQVDVLPLRSPVSFAVECINGSVCVEQMSVRCIEEQRVCNGIMDCPDNSDETNCLGELS